MECGGTKMKKGGWIAEAIKKPGSFTKQAQSAGMSVSGFRNKVLANKSDYSSTTVKRANLAKTLSKMRKGEGGMKVGVEPKKPFTLNPAVEEAMKVVNRPTAPLPDLSGRSVYMENFSPSALKPVSEVTTNSSDSVGMPSAKSTGLVKGGTEKVAAYQRMLKAKGYNVDVDGAWGKNTQAAYEKYMRSTTKSSSRMGPENYNSDFGKVPTNLPSVSLPSSSGIKSPGVKRKIEIQKLLSDSTLPSVSLPTSGGIKKKFMMGGSIPGVNGSIVGPAVPTPKTGQSFPRRNAGTSKLAKFKKK
jgi:hypothetical protein